MSTEITKIIVDALLSYEASLDDPEADWNHRPAADAVLAAIASNGLAIAARTSGNLPDDTLVATWGEVQALHERAESAEAERANLEQSVRNYRRQAEEYAAFADADECDACGGSGAESLGRACEFCGGDGAETGHFSRGYRAAIDEVERQARQRGFAPEDMDQGTQWFRILDGMAGRECRA